MTSTALPLDAAEHAPAYPLYRAAGTHRGLGRQHGEQAAVRIGAHLDALRSSLGFSGEQFKRRALTFLPLFERYCPHLVEELQGLAEGAGIAFHEALAVNVRAALGTAPEEGCTSFVISAGGTANGEPLIGQTSDTLPNVMDFGYVLRLEPVDKPKMLMWTFGGMLGYHGLNSAGVAQFANDLGEGGPPARFGLPHYPFKRLLLECSSLAEVVDLFERLPLASNGNYVVCDGRGAILDVEATTAGPAFIHDDGAGFIAHANHFCASQYATEENHQQSVTDSFPRQERIDTLLGRRFGSLTVDALQALLRDHDNHPASICRHPRSVDPADGFEQAGQTVAALVAEPASGRLHISYGPPCESPFVSYTLDA